MVFAAGYALAIVTGVALGVLMGGMPRLGETLEIYVNALNSTPRVAFIPFIILWFGLGPTAKIVVVWFQAVMPIVINTYAGVQNTDPDLLEAARSFGAQARPDLPLHHAARGAAVHRDWACGWAAPTRWSAR